MGKTVNKLKIRSLFISDVHLGTLDCHTDQLFDFLHRVECENLYLLGDIVDFWKADNGGWYWSQRCTNILHLIMDKAQRGTRVVYIPGNHDQVLRDYAFMDLVGFQMCVEYVHQSPTGKRFLLIHGDELDGAVKHNRLLLAVGSTFYDWLLMPLNRGYNRLRRWLGLPLWSLSLFIKDNVKKAAAYIDSYERAAAHEAIRRGFDGVVCGHIHKAALREVDGVSYMNAGDWVESCSAIVEDFAGELRLLRWAEERVSLVSVPPPQRAAA